MRLVVPLLLAAGLAVSTGCGSGSSAPVTAAGCTGGTPVTLTVKNYLSWCSVSVDGGAASSAAVQSVCAPAGAVPLAATALVGFNLGTAPWHGTTGDSGSGDAGTITGTGQAATSSATVTAAAGAHACAWVCCPTNGLSDCPTTSQCP